MYSLRSPEIPLSPPGRPEFPCGSPQGPDFDYRRGPLPPSPQPRYPDDQSLTTSLPPPCSGSFCLPVLPNTQLLHLRIQSRRRKRTQVRAAPSDIPTNPSLPWRRWYCRPSVRKNTRSKPLSSNLTSPRTNFALLTWVNSPSRRRPSSSPV